MDCRRSVQVVVSVALLLGTLLGCGGRPPGVITRTPTSPTRPATGTPVPTATHTPTPAATAPRTATPTSTITSAPMATVPLMSPTAMPMQPVDASSDVVKRGLDVYQKYCGQCHTLDDAGTEGILGPPHNKIGTVAVQRVENPSYEGKASTAADYIRESIVAPETYIVDAYAESRISMPAFDHLSDSELTALVQMLVQQK